VGDYKTYITFRMLLDSVAAFSRRRQPPSLDYFCAKYELSESQALGILNWLIHEGFLHTVGGQNARYVPTRDFTQTPIMEALDAIENQNRRIPASPDDAGRAIVAGIVGNLAVSCGGQLRDLTFERLITDIESARAAPPGLPGRR
jgi:hypothetical protein